LLEPWITQKLISRGVVDGLNNNKAKVTMRKSYGFRTYRVLELALYHSLGKLPEPESTHDFFCRKYALASVSIVLLHQRSEVVRQAADVWKTQALRAAAYFSGSAKVSTAPPEGIVMYWRPSIAYVMGELASALPVLKCHISFPERASSAIR
jgi:hypothetical protein